MRFGVRGVVCVFWGGRGAECGVAFVRAGRKSDASDMSDMSEVSDAWPAGILWLCHIGRAELGLSVPRGRPAE